jgi:glycosyltransferase involved in cell wall biosynthesis
LDSQRLEVIPNPVEAAKLDMPADFPREEKRAELGIDPEHVLAVFIALGHFERKGLPEVLEAIASTDPKVRLVVVGGSSDLVASYRSRADRLALDGRVTFVGMQPDVRPFLWAADVFVSASSYETFSLTLHQAAAAGLVLVTTPLQGAAPFFRDGVHGLLTERGPADIAKALTAVSRMPSAKREYLGENARRAVEDLGAAGFADAWRAVYREALTNPK